MEPGPPNIEMERFRQVEQLLTDSERRSRDLQKMMLDPLDVLNCLLDDPEIQAVLEEVGINRDDVVKEIDRTDEETPKGFNALRLLNITVGGVEPHLRHGYRSFVLDMSIQEAVNIANSEGSLEVTSRYVLAGMIRHGWNTAAIVFRNLGISQRQINILSRLQ